MKAPQKGLCIECGKPYRKGANVRIRLWPHDESPLARMRHVRCEPSKGRPNDDVVKRKVSA
jgi:hypothetical protein